MKIRKFRSIVLFLFCAVVSLSGVLCANAANAPRDPMNNGRQAYAGSGIKCMVTNDFYAVNFTAMQEGQVKGETTPFVRYCQEIPATGKTFLTVDLLDRDVRTTPLSLRVVEEEINDGRLPKIKRTITETPAKVYKNGTAEIVADLMQAGHYALMVTIGDRDITEDDHLRVPFSVALESPTKKSDWLGKFTGFVVVLFFSIMGYIGFRTYRAYRPHKAEGTLVSSSGAQS
ncbi:hypothetical protein F6R98_12855 [Candidatus Methylospira mobilis]|uniref:Uncharacterized protein n=1 Tax=Candidatus Methylospira mobilis TaxID=1808979 RepID=A0A5Q0BHU4_9GAMM|nr:hypothetical protein [Candidatus Methylospira mobilis]QFY43393.1 hypothetical protein F6R98_12855 [Candidatus Methylospira mobilis]WNV03370.1 hypothetical protein RP726_12980 [Candidatus Methylospira mobilis]